VGSCYEHGNEFSVSIKCWEVREWLHSWRLLKKGSAPVVSWGFTQVRLVRVKSVYLFSLCVVPLLSSRFTATALVWFSDFLNYLVFHFFISVSTVFIYIYIFMDLVVI
jgi:hypothetical protein